MEVQHGWYSSVQRCLDSPSDKARRWPGEGDIGKETGWDTHTTNEYENGVMRKLGESVVIYMWKNINIYRERCADVYWKTKNIYNIYDTWAWAMCHISSTYMFWFLPEDSSYQIIIWGQFGSGHCKRNWPVARIPFNDIPWHLNWVGCCPYMVSCVYWGTVFTPVNKTIIFWFWPLPPPKQECGTKIKHFHEIGGEGVSTVGLPRVLHPKNPQILQTRKVHPQVTYFNMLTFGSFQNQRRNQSTNHGMIWVLAMCPQNLVYTYLMRTYMCTMVKIPDFGDGHCMTLLPFSLGNPFVNHLFLNGPSHISNKK